MIVTPQKLEIIKKGGRGIFSVEICKEEQHNFLILPLKRIFGLNSDVFFYRYNGNISKNATLNFTDNCLIYMHVCPTATWNQKGTSKVFNTVPIITDVSVCILDFSSVGHPLSGDPKKKRRYNSNSYNS